MIRAVLLALALLLAPAVDPALAQTLAQSVPGGVSFDRGQLDIVSGSGRHHFTIELALTPDQQTQGLMFRRELAPDAGMLFLYPSEQSIAMWMKNTLIPLDMIFIKADGTVLHVAERAVPRSLATIPSGGDAKAVLEVNGGIAAKLGIKPGDKVIYPGLGTG